MKMSLVPCHFIKFFTVASWILHILIAKASSEKEEDEYPLSSRFSLGVPFTVSPLDRLPSASAFQQFVTNNYHNLINMSSASVSQQFGGR